MIELVKMNNNQSKLLEDNINLIYKFLCERGIYDEDVRSEAVLYVCDRMYRYDPSKGKISTFIYGVLRNMLSAYYVAQKAEKRKINYTYKYCLDAPFGKNEDSPLLNEMVGSVDGNYDYNDLYDITKKHLKKYTPKKRKIFKLHMQDKSLREIGKIMGCSWQYINVVINDIQKNLRREICQ